MEAENQIDEGQPAPDEPDIPAQFLVDGEWLGASSLDPIEIGPTNFRTLTNMRYTDKHVEGVQGYTKVHESAVDATYDDITGGIQLITGRGTDYMIAVAENPAGERKLFYSTSAVPATAATWTALTTGRASGGAGTAYADTSGKAFSLKRIPNNHIVYSNGDESYIWGGAKTDPAAIFLCDDTSLTNPRSYFKEMKNTLTDSLNVMSVAAASTDVWTVHSTRPLHGVYFEVSTANDTASSLTCHVWTGSWTAVGNASNGTLDSATSTISLAQSGLYAFDSTVASAVRKHVEGTYFYCYRFQLSAGTATISHIQVDAPFQKIVDIWDGVPRESNFVAFDAADLYDRTAHVVEASTTVAIGCDISTMTGTDRLYAMLEGGRACAIKVQMLEDAVNTGAAALTVEYWDGDSWATCSNIVDGTSNGTDSFAKSGLISWEPPAFSSERPREKEGRFGYLYRLSMSSGTVDGSSENDETVVIDVLRLIPAPITPGPFVFHDEFRGRHLGIGSIATRENNRADFTAPYAIDVWNGEQSSDDGFLSVRFNTHEKPTGGAALYNRYGTREFEVYAAFTNSSMHQIKEGEEEGEIFSVDKISDSIGCPCPKTITATGMGMDFSDYEAKRNMILWIDSSGPYYYDGSVPVYIKGIEKYFDPNESVYVGSDISDARAWIDPIYREWNVVLSSTVHVVYDIRRRKWYRKDATSYPKSGWVVIGPNGDKYNYAGLSSGFVVRLEYGNTWDGTGITQTWMTGDFFPSQNIWHQTLIRRFKLIARAIEEDYSVEVLYSGDTDATDSGVYEFEDTDAYEWEDTDAYEFESSTVTSISLGYGDSSRVVRRTINMNHRAWCHAFGARVTTTSTDKGFQPLGWGIEYRFAHMDH